MAYVPIKIPPGFYRSGTQYNSKGRWFSGNLVRFVEDVVTPVGGWVYQTDSGTGNPIALVGTPRGALGWEVAGGRNWQAYGTAGATTLLYAFSLGALYDISLEGIANLFTDTFTQANGTDLNTLGYSFPSAGFMKVNNNQAYGVWAGSFNTGYPYITSTFLTYGNSKTYEVYADITREAVGTGAGVVFWSKNVEQSEYCVVYLETVDASNVAIKMKRYAGGTYDASTVAATYALTDGQSLRIGVIIDQDNATVTPFREPAGGGTRTTYSAWTHTDGTWHSDGLHLHVGVFLLGVGSAAYAGWHIDNLTVDEQTSGFAASNIDSSWGAGSGATYYGQGNYGDGTYGSGQPAGVMTEADVWHLDNFGNYLVATQIPSNDSIYWFDPATPTTKAALVGGAPTSNRGLVVTPERFLVALGAGGDVRKVQWADRESLTTWTPTSTNEAGSYNLEGRGRIIAGRRGRLETLIWTDADLFSMQYIGLPYVFSFQKKASACGLTGPLAVAEMNGMHVWMGLRGFFVYDGYVRELPCEVADYVFSDMNRDQRVKISAWVNHEFKEVTWFYPSSGSDENDRYVTWNYENNWWTTGFQERTSAIPSTSTNLKPVLLNASGSVLLHESGWDHTIEQATNYTPYIESGPVEIGNGDETLHVLKVIPDEANLGDVVATIFTSLFPMESESNTGALVATSETDVRTHGRWARIYLAENAAGDWRIGTFRLDVRRGGRR